MTIINRTKSIHQLILVYHSPNSRNTAVGRI